MIIGNGIVITNDQDNNVYQNGAVLVQGNVIKAVGGFAELKKQYPDEEVFDVAGKVIMPGMINTHSHIYSSYARGMSASEPTVDFLTVLENLWWRLDRNLTLEDVRLNAYTTYIESIQNGVTTLFDHHASAHAVEHSLFTIAEVAQELGIRTSLCFELSDRDGAEIRDQQIKENIDFIKATQKDDRGDMIHGLFGMHASFTLSNETMDKALEAMAGVYDGYHIHIAEGIEDQYDSLAKYGRRVVERLHDFGILGEHTLGIHGVHINQREIEILKATDTSCVHNPESNMNNALGCPPIVSMLEQGLRVGLGTDAYTHDMFESMKVANILQSHQLCDPTKGFGETITMQFKNNPKICAKFFEKPLGVLAEGAYADIITLDYLPHTPLNENTWMGHVLFGLTGRLTVDNMINGKFVMKNREIQNADVEAIYAKSSERAAEVWKNM